MQRQRERALHSRKASALTSHSYTQYAASRSKITRREQGRVWLSRTTSCVSNEVRTTAGSRPSPSAGANQRRVPLNDTSSVKLRLNDDAEEKAARLQSRHALHDRNMNEIKKAATPRKLSNYNRAGDDSPSSNVRTPGHPRARDDDLEGGVMMVGGKAVTPMKRVPLLANFEEWMKMATDNKINAANSWNFALIDYFHDMSLLKEGDGVNFQRASVTLDGCVKIYTSRVDSVATETGKLLSGLADSGNNKKKRGENEDGEDSEEDVEGEDGTITKKPKKRVCCAIRSLRGD